MKRKQTILAMIVLGMLASLAAAPLKPSEDCPDTGTGKWYKQPNGFCWYEHSEEEYTGGACAGCHPEMKPVELPDWYPLFRVLDGKLVTVWTVDGNECTLGNGDVVPCDALYWIPPLPPCKYKNIQYLARSRQ